MSSAWGVSARDVRAALAGCAVAEVAATAQRNSLFTRNDLDRSVS